MLRLGSITRITLIAILCGIAGTTAAKADLIFNFSGEMQTIIYNNVSIGTPEPFTQGEPVTAQLRLIGDNLPTTPNSVFTGFVQFGTVSGENTIFGVQTASITLSSTLTSVDYCCRFSGLTYNGSPFQSQTLGENGQALFGLDTDIGSFTALYLPTGTTNVNVTAHGSGIWTAAPVPEPASIGLLGFAVAALGIGLRLRHRTS